MNNDPDRSDQPIVSVFFSDSYFRILCDGTGYNRRKWTEAENEAVLIRQPEENGKSVLCQSAAFSFLKNI